MSDGYDISGHFVCNAISGVSFSWICSGRVAGAEETKPGDCGFIFLRGCICGRADNGESVSGARLLFSIGMRSNVDLAMKLGLKVGRGIVVNSGMETSMKGVYAAGDCAEVEGRNYGLFSISMEQGAVAGVNAAGGASLWKPPMIPYVMQALGVQTFVMGKLEGEVLRRDDTAGYRALYHREGKTVGVIWIGAKCPMAALRKAVTQGAAIEEVHL